ncbi:MAG: hypothetical protein LBE22_04065 [Azoarcus sp.]|nr:hypothetical protein [Azoarcus sp.]
MTATLPDFTLAYKRNPCPCAWRYTWLYLPVRVAFRGFSGREQNDVGAEGDWQEFAAMNVEDPTDQFALEAALLINDFA